MDGHNCVDPPFLAEIADALDSFDAEPEYRVVVLVADGPSFCAGADFSAMNAGGDRPDSSAICMQAMRLYRTKQSNVAAIQGTGAPWGARWGCPPLACTRGSRGFDLGRSQARQRVSIALWAADLWVPTSVWPASGEGLAVAYGASTVR